MSAEVVCVGLATADLIVELPHWPEPDGRLVVESVRRAGGGPAATAAVAATRLGRRVAMCGAIGTDEAGRRVRDGLVAEGVDVELLVKREGSTAESVILLDRSAATRSILHAPGVTLEAPEPGAVADIGAAAWVHVDHAGWSLAVAAGVPRSRLSVDAGNPIDGLELTGLGLYAPTARAITDRYPGRVVGEASAAALADGAQRVVVTLGAGGALAADGSGAWIAPPVPVDVRSTLGAGDVFHGALVAGLAEGRSLPDALAMANVTAALSCRGVDGRETIPFPEELAAALNDAPPVEPILLDEVR
jgi:sugar/nucleoside kinase (ribokinase family)